MVVMEEGMEDFVSSLRDLSATELMRKKDSIEGDIKELNDVLQTVRELGSEVT